MGKKKEGGIFFHFGTKDVAWESHIYVTNLTFLRYDTLALLWGMMMLVEYLKDDALFDMFVSRFFVENQKLTPTKLLWLVAISCGCMSALFTNDTMCIALTKTICYVCTQRGFHPGPQMVNIAMTANLGSAATLIGNPQNAIIAALSGVPFAVFLAYSIVAMVICLIINTFFLAIWYRADLAENTAFAAAAKEKMAEAGVFSDRDGAIPDGTDEASPLISTTEGLNTEGNKICCFKPESSQTNRSIFRYALLIIIVGTLTCFLLDILSIGWIAAGGACIAIAFDAIISHKVPDRILARVNWELLVFFSGLFVVIEG